MIYLYFLPFTNEVYKSKIEKICERLGNGKDTASVTGKLLAKFAAYEKTGVPMEKVKLCYGKNGKPFFEDAHHIYFNISHTEGAVAVAIGDSEVGVDIEKIKEARMNVATKFFSQNEMEYIEKSADKNKAFYEVWTRKEAFVKMTGEGLKREKLGLCTFEKEIMTSEKDGYIISVCSKNEEKVSEKEEFIENFIKECEKMMEKRS